MSLDKELTEKAIRSFLDFSLVEIADEQSFISWIDKDPYAKRPNWASRKTEYSYWLVGSNGVVSGALDYWTNYVDVIYSKTALFFNTDIRKADANYNNLNNYIFSERIDHDSNWDAWVLPKIKKQVPVDNDDSPLNDGARKKKKSKKTPMKIVEEWGPFEIVITSYSFTFFITEKQMESFTGLRVQTPSLTLHN